MIFILLIRLVVVTDAITSIINKIEQTEGNGN